VGERGKKGKTQTRQKDAEEKEREIERKCNAKGTQLK